MSNKIVEYLMKSLLAVFSLTEAEILFSCQKECYNVCTESQRF